MHSVAGTSEPTTHDPSRSAVTSGHRPYGGGYNTIDAHLRTLVLSTLLTSLWESTRQGSPGFTPPAQLYRTPGPTDKKKLSPRHILFTDDQNIIRARFHKKHGVGLYIFPSESASSCPPAAGDAVQLSLLILPAPSPGPRVYVRTYHNRELICTDACYHQSAPHSTLSFLSFSPGEEGIGRALRTSHMFASANGNPAPEHFNRSRRRLSPPPLPALRSRRISALGP